MEILQLFGRGGSDTTAVAIAATLNANRCDIYTDVDGVYSTDPKIVENVKKIPEISYDEMLELASMGAKVLHNRCVEIGKKYNIPIVVKSSFEPEKEGTLVGGNIDMEKMCIRGIAKDENIIGIEISNLKSTDMSNMFNSFSKEGISTDMILTSNDKKIYFTIKKENEDKTNKIIDCIHDCRVKLFKDISKISIIGTGLINNPIILGSIIDELEKNNIEILMLTTSEIRISIIVNKEYANDIVNILHSRLIKK